MREIRFSQVVNRHAQYSAQSMAQLESSALPTSPHIKPQEQFEHLLHLIPSIHRADSSDDMKREISPKLILNICNSSGHGVHTQITAGTCGEAD